MYDGVAGALSISSCDWEAGGNVYHCRHVLVALVEAVLTLGAGSRSDPRSRQGSYTALSRAPEKDPNNLRVHGIALADWGKRGKGART
jgi:hypothetical protein